MDSCATGRWKRRALAFASLLVLGLQGCVPTLDGSTFYCERNEDCPSWMVCNVQQSRCANLADRDAPDEVPDLPMADTPDESASCEACSEIPELPPGDAPDCIAKPEILERCNGFDDNCDGQTDENADADCQDDLECTIDQCVAGGCRHVITQDACRIEGSCLLKDARNPADRCLACRPDLDRENWTPIDPTTCDDDNPCTEDSCNSSDGTCTHSGLGCDDQDACTTDWCDAGAGSGGGCQHEVLPSTECQHCADGLDGSCVPPDQCTNVRCDAGADSLGLCVFTPLGCDDGNPCTRDFCVPETGCRHDDRPDGFACESGKTCATGQCVGGPCPPGWELIEGVRFEIGSPESEPGHQFDESPQHSVLVSRSMCVKRTEVTRAEWTELVASTPSTWPECGSDCPVACVNWWEALAFCNALSTRLGLEPCYVLEGCTDMAPGAGTGCTGTAGEGFECTSVRFDQGLDCPGFRLPTEAEWEFLTRAGTTSALFDGPLGSDHLECVAPELAGDAWFCGNAESKPHAVGGLNANAFALQDVLGNVQEWCWDRYGVYADQELTDPLGASTGDMRVFRGGGWRSQARFCRVASRNEAQPYSRMDDVGLRVVRSIPSPARAKAFSNP